MQPSFGNPGLKMYVKSLFDLFDVDDSNDIDKEEFQKLCVELGYFFHKDELEQIFSIIDTDNSNTIEFEEYWKFWQDSDKFKIHNPEKLRLYRAALKSFREYDIDGDGKISLDEYKAIAKTANWGQTEQEMQESLAKLDADGDGEISFDEYVSWLGWL